MESTTAPVLRGRTGTWRGSKGLKATTVAAGVLAPSATAFYPELSIQRGNGAQKTVRWSFYLLEGRVTPFHHFQQICRRSAAGKSHPCWFLLLRICCCLLFAVLVGLEVMVIVRLKRICYASQKKRFLCERSEPRLLKLRYYQARAKRVT